VVYRQIWLNLLVDDLPVWFLAGYITKLECKKAQCLFTWKKERFLFSVCFLLVKEKENPSG
jgi:hypothetical protein